MDCSFNAHKKFFGRFPSGVIESVRTDSDRPNGYSDRLTLCVSSQWDAPKCSFANWRFGERSFVVKLLDNQCTDTASKPTHHQHRDDNGRTPAQL